MSRRVELGAAEGYCDVFHRENLYVSRTTVTYRSLKRRKIDAPADAHRDLFCVGVFACLSCFLVLILKTRLFILC